MPRPLPPSWMALSFCLAVAGSAAAAPPLHPGPVRSVDGELVEIGRQIAGFGGLYYDESGRPNVYLLDPEGDGSAALKSLGAETVVHRGDYEFERLLEWRLTLRPILALPGVVFLDADEAKNRVVIGLDSSSPDKDLDRERLEQGLLSTAVPRQAVLVEEAVRVELLVGLRDKLRPAPGGAQIVFSSFVCTLGFNAFKGKVFGFVVNSHCSDVFGAAEATRYFQSEPASANGIGIEVFDPGFFTDPPCPPGRGCRWSDSAFAKYDKKSLGGVRKLARPTSGGSDTGSITLKTAGARFTVTGRTDSPLVGDLVHKVGRTTGWTFGHVVGTCMDVNAEQNSTFLCQSAVQLGGGPGDSGAPVFYRLAGNKARLVGLLWGGGVNPDLGVVGIFSPLENVEADLGPLKVH